MDDDRGQEYIPQVTMPLEKAFEPGVFIDPGGQFPHIDAAAGQQDQQDRYQIGARGYKDNTRHDNR